VRRRLEVGGGVWSSYIGGGGTTLLSAAMATLAASEH